MNVPCGFYKTTVQKVFRLARPARGLAFFYGCVITRAAFQVAYVKKIYAPIILRSAKSLQAKTVFFVVCPTLVVQNWMLWRGNPLKSY